MSIGLHFNITEGKPISTEVSSLVDEFGVFLGKFGNSCESIDSNSVNLKLI